MRCPSGLGVLSRERKATFGKIFKKMVAGLLPAPILLYTLVQNAAELRARAREGVLFDNLVVREE